MAAAEITGNTVIILGRCDIRSYGVGGSYVMTVLSNLHYSLVGKIENPTINRSINWNPGNIGNTWYWGGDVHGSQNTKGKNDCPYRCLRDFGVSSTITGVRILAMIRMKEMIARITSKGKRLSCQKLEALQKAAWESISKGQHEGCIASVKALGHARPVEVWIHRGEDCQIWRTGKGRIRPIINLRDRHYSVRSRSGEATPTRYRGVKRYTEVSFGRGGASRQKLGRNDSPGRRPRLEVTLVSRGRSSTGSGSRSTSRNRGD